MQNLSNQEIMETISNQSINKANSKAWRLFLLAILAGAYIALGAQGSLMASFELTANSDSTFGIGRLISAAVFPVGLMLVVLCGGELFTGNALMILGIADKKIRWKGLLRNWCFVYIGNFIGSILLVWLMYESGLWTSSDGLLGMMTIKTALNKVNLTFGQAFVRGIFCNWLVCLAICMATGSREVIGKIFAIWFCIGLFVLSGFEHSVANMYFIPAGIIASGNEAFAGLLYGGSAGLIDTLTWSNFLLKNLLPVTLGNIVGGSLFVGMAYWSVNKIGVNN